MPALTKEERDDAVKQALASEAIEGYQADPEFLALLASYVAGEVTAEEIQALTKKAFLNQP